MHSCNNFSNCIGIFKRVVIFSLLIFCIPVLAQPLVDIFAESEVFVASDKQSLADVEADIRLHLPVDSSNSPTINLPALSSPEKQALQTDELAKPLAIGIGRNSALNEIFDAALLNWTTITGGNQAAVFTVASAGAEALRLKLLFESIPFGTEIRFFNPQTSEITDPVKQQDIFNTHTRGYWSPVIKGEMIGMEVVIPAGSQPDEVSFTVPLLSHLFVSPEELSFDKNLIHIGSSGSCNNDVACATGIPLTLINSVAKYVVTDQSGGSFLCTGTLLADTDTTTFIPYFFTANHCVDNSNEATSMEFYWFFQRASCGGPNPVTVTRQAGGATLLSTGINTDHTLLRLNQNPPAGVGLSGWTNTPVTAGSDVISIHHPQGDLKKISFGNAQGFAPYLGNVNGNGSFIYTQWFDGTTEPGSSGSGLWAEFNNDLYLVGSLFGGFAACGAQNAPDYYGRFDLTFPLIEDWLNPPQSDFTNVWWDPARSGQGIQIVQNGNQISGAWYLYDRNGNGMWVTFIGSLSNNRVTASLLRFTGPALGTVWDDGQVEDSVVGQVTIDFTSVQAATFNYVLDGVSDVLQLQPFSPGANGIFTKVWWDPTQSGQGVQILQEGSGISGAWYLYDDNGEGMWVTFSDILAGDTVTANLLRFTGPPLGIPWNNNLIDNTVAGTVTLRFLSSAAATMTYTIEGFSGLLNLQPFNP